jgi:hypothetical protein
LYKLSLRTVKEEEPEGLKVGGKEFIDKNFI